MQNFIPFISYVFIVTFTPGPNNIMSMVNATKYGYKKTFNFMFGVFTGFFILLLISSYSNLFLYKYIPKIEPFMKIIGGIYMIYLAYIIVKPTNNDKKELIKTNTFKAGLTLQLVNIKLILYCITIMGTFFESKLVLIFFSFLLAFIGFISLNCWAFFGSFFNKLIEKYEKSFNIIMASLLIYSALLVSGVI